MRRYFLLFVQFYLISFAAAAPVLQDSTQQQTQPLSYVKCHNADTLLYESLDYNTFADVFEWLPPAYYYDRGSEGQLAIGSLFSGVEGHFQLFYDGLNLNDPLNGLSDMNMVPVESVGRINIITSGINRQYGYLPLGQTVQLYSKDMARLPIRSTVSYRTGNSGYDDIDARLGIKASQKLSLNMGGVIKSYSGTVYNSEYDAQKINLKINRKINENWAIEYLYLLNKFDLDVPVSQDSILKDISIPHQKDFRTDHGFCIKRGNSFFTSIQLTDLKREFYGYRHTVVDQLHNVNGTRITTQYNQQFGLFSFNTGAGYRIYHLESKDWGNHTQRAVNGWINAAIKSRDKYYIGTGAVIENHKGYDTFIQQELNMEYRYKPDLLFFGWANHFINAPQFEPLYTQGPYARGNPDLEEENFSQIGAGLETRIKKLEIYTAFSAQYISNQIAADAGAENIKYINQIDHSRLAMDFSIKYDFIRQLSFYAKGKYTYITSGDPYFDVSNIPDFSAKGYIQYQNVFFTGDLDTRIRIGALFLGESFRPQYYFVQYPIAGYPVSPVFVPYLHAIFVIKDFTVFFSMKNMLDLDYERVYGYPMPGAQFKWGFTFKFFD
ncbi:hypothetical protein JXQ31_10010 [candidate division KSB1 bacterium]|nr:hypothetical protein [candidate division KSB1 bacterium]